MDENLASAIGVVGCAAAICAYLAVKAWVNGNRREREAFYRAEAIKKVAEMRGATPEPVLEVLREALKPQPEPASPWGPQVWAPGWEKVRQREILAEIAEKQGARPETAIDILREEERIRGHRVREGLKLAGMITAGVGAGLFVFLKQLLPDMPVYLVGLIPILVGAAFLAYVFVLAPEN